MLSYMHCIHLTYLGVLNRDDCDGQDMQHAWSYPEMHTEFQWENLKERDLQGGRDVDESINIKIYLREVDCNPGDWIAILEDRDQQQAYVRVVMNLRVP